MNKNKKIYVLLVIAAAFLLVQSCQSFPKIEMWVLEEDVYQYYIRMTELKGEDTRSDVVIDFTYHQYRENPEKNDVVCNFSVLGKETLSPDLDSAYFIINNNPSDKILLQDLKLMFIKGSEDKVRFTSHIADKDFKKLVSAEEYLFVTEFERPQKTFEFKPGNRFLKQMEGAKTDIYGL
jgi:hypothetical protein